MQYYKGYHIRDDGDYNYVVLHNHEEKATFHNYKDAEQWIDGRDDVGEFETEPAYVQCFEEIRMAIVGESVNENTFEVNLYYGNSDNCEVFDADCSSDGLLWSAGDMGSPYLCTHHYFDPESGYDFYDPKAPVDFESIRQDFKTKLQGVYGELLKENGISTGDIDPLTSEALENAENELATVVANWIKLSEDN